MLILADGHVHVHRCFERQAFFDAAFANLLHGSVQLGLRGPTLGCLFLTEVQGDDFFQEARRSVGRITWGPWSAAVTGEENSLWVRRDRGATLLVVAGRQIATAERLEVLALGLTRTPADGRALPETLDFAISHHALPVIPWGFGKWWGSRGRLVDGIIRSVEPGRLFLGDNGGRPRGSPRPRLFRLAEKRGVLVLPGSDPLPFAFEANKVGRYGFLVDCDLARGRPAQAVLTAVRGTKTQPLTFGRRESLLRSCRAQLALRLRSHRAPARRSADPS